MIDTDGRDVRAKLKKAKRIVVKVGTQTLVSPSGKPSVARFAALVEELAALVHSGKEVILVSSGAIGCGLEVLKRKRRPTELADLQMAAAIGQCRLMALYHDLFSREGVPVGQVLLTADDLKHRTRHVNARDATERLLTNGVVPIFNENDVISVDEIKFGDNDQLAALMTLLVEADVLVLLTTSDGLQARSKGGSQQRLSYVRTITKDTYTLVYGKQDALSVGGMASKLEATERVVNAGGVVVIASGAQERVLSRVLDGEDIGTLFGTNTGEYRIKGRKRWLAFFHKAQGLLEVDAGAKDALLKRGRSLLASGLREVRGSFGVGSVVDVCGPDSVVVARGVVEFPSDTLRVIRGKKSAEIASMLGPDTVEEVIHRSNLVVLHQEEAN